jgi:16S rRNA (cytosine967-C5)-methyltransferase
VLEARRIAHQVLVRVEKGGAFANRALDATIQEAGRLDPRDVGLATELAYGTLRWQVAIDHALKHFSRRPLGDLDFETRALLRLGAHQLLNMRVAEHAAVHATVELAKEVRRGAPVKYVNAVLRSLGRERQNILVPPASVDPEGWLSVTEAFPRWICERMIAWHGLEGATSRLRALNHPAPLPLRVNARRGTRHDAEHRLKADTGFDALPTRYSPVGLTVESARTTRDLLRPDHGLWQAQDEAAQLVGFFAAPEPGWTVLDACAAPGGKSCHLAELMDDRGRVDASDVHAGKLREIADGARRLGLSSVSAHAADASLPLPFAPEGGYDLVLADAPCSGLGTIRRHPELKTRRTPEDVARLAELQGRILDNLAGVVKPGGVLVYSVCTFTKEEGPDRVEAFLHAHPDFHRAPPPAGPVRWDELLDAKGDLVLDAHHHGTDAFHAARLVRR